MKVFFRPNKVYQVQVQNESDNKDEVQGRHLIGGACSCGYQPHRLKF